VKFVGKLKKKVVKRSNYVHTVYYIILSSHLVKSVSTFREIIERRFATIRLLNELFTATVAREGTTYYLLIPYYVVRRHPELEKLDYVEYEIVS